MKEINGIIFLGITFKLKKLRHVAVYVRKTFKLKKDLKCSREDAKQGLISLEEVDEA